jgi:hypothetical protein
MFIKDIFSEKTQEMQQTKTFFTRKDFKEICDEEKSYTINSYHQNKRTENSNELLLKLNEDLNRIIENLFKKNEQNREYCIEIAIEKSYNFYKENMSDLLEKVCLEQNRFEENSVETKGKAYEMLNEVCGGENELKETYFLKVTF